MVHHVGMDVLHYGSFGVHRGSRVCVTYTISVLVYDTP